MFQKKLNLEKNKKDDEILIKDWKETKNQETINEIIERHIGLVHKIANGYKSSGLNAHDLVAEGILGLIHSVEEFKVSKNVKFSTYAYYWIRSKIHLYAWKARNMFNISISKKNTFIFSLMKEIQEEKISKEEAIKKIAEKERLSLKEAGNHMKLLSFKMKSLNEKINGNWKDGEKEESWEDYVTNNDHQNIIEEIDTRHIKNLIEDILLEFKENQRVIINERWLTETPKTLKELGEQLNLSIEGVRKLEIKTLNQLREAIGAKLYFNENYKSLMTFLFYIKLNMT